MTEHTSGRMKGLVCLLLLLETFVCVVHPQVDGGLGGNEISHQLRSEDGGQNPLKADTWRAEASPDSRLYGHLCLPDIHAALRGTDRHRHRAESGHQSLETRLRDAEKAAEQQTFVLEELSKKHDGVNISQYCLCFSTTDREIAFSASLLQSGSGDIGPSTTDIILVYRNVFTNIGNAYNPITGIFTAPLKGVYVFTFSVYAHGSQSNPANAHIVKNGKDVLKAYAHQTQGALNSSKAVVLVLEAGDVVYVKLWPSSKIQDNGNNHNTFSGYMLFPLR
ncbi:complement C1q-like protein 2 [Rhinichthys klamathensis goyatoka]|uniref:complement C1q-like protein 2 n=1 Tax=Rhinichthys klamathensis goyatoka TaxID=3034132 RepID=UPI0024B56C12|nr:complement C1q-like protein 2 [Rhinichthys klamathensis goyatoka]